MGIKAFMMFDVPVNASDNLQISENIVHRTSYIV
jgi:hypothetical protein